MLDTDQRGRVHSVFDANYHDTTIELSQPKGAAFQLAPWEAIDVINFALAAARSSRPRIPTTATCATSPTGSSRGKDYSGPRKWVITELSSDTVQDLGTVNAIPLPAAAWLLLGVSGGLVAAKRRLPRPPRLNPRSPA